MRTLLLVLALVVAAAPAGAAPITFNWSGTVDPGNVFPMVVPADAPVSFALTYDLDQANTCAAGRGFFSIAGSMSLLGHTFNTIGGGVEVNNPLGNLCSTPIPGFVPGTISGYELRLFFGGSLPIDYTNPGGPAIPLGFGFVVLYFGAPFDGTLHALGESRNAGIISYALGGNLLFTGEAAHRSVPEPTILVLTAIGVAALRRRATRA
jgi:hypothetical protein